MYTRTAIRTTTIVLSVFIHAECVSHFWKEVHTQSGTSRNGISVLWSVFSAKARNINPRQNTILRWSDKFKVHNVSLEHIQLIHFSGN